MKEVTKQEFGRLYSQMVNEIMNKGGKPQRLVMNSRLARTLGFMKEHQKVLCVGVCKLDIQDQLQGNFIMMYNYGRED